MNLNPIKNLGIFCFEPNDLKISNNPELVMSTQYFEVKRDDNYFFNFITGIIDFLEGEIPDFSDACSLCNLKRKKFY